MDKKVSTLLMHLPINLYDVRDYDVIIQPYGLAAISAYLKRYGYDVIFKDAHAYHMSRERILQFVKESNPTIIGLPIFTSQLPQTISFLKDVKSILPGIISVVGGPHASEEYRSLLEHNGQEIDIVVIGEGEYTMREIIDCIQNDRSLEGVKGIAYKSQEGVRVNPFREYIHDLDSLPYADWDALPMKEYWGVWTERKNFVNIVFSRGCPFLCTFCGAKKALGRVHRRRSPANVIEELRFLYEKHRMRDIGLSDSTFNVDNEWVSQICEGILKMGRRDLVWGCNLRLDKLDRATLKLMKRSGCTKVFIGVESGDDVMLKAMKKGTNIGMVRDGVRMLEEIGFLVFCGFIVGMPGETEETIKKTMALAKQLRKHSCAFSLATPFPGTEFAKTAEMEGFKVDDWSKHDTYGLTYIPKGMTREELQNAYNIIVRNNYLSFAFLYRQVMQMRSWLQFKQTLRLGLRIIFGRLKRVKSMART